MTNYSASDLMDRTAAELRDMCKDMGIPGMSKARKDVIVNKILEVSGSSTKFTYDELSEKINNELRDICTTLGISGVSKKPKSVLIDMIMAANKAKKSEPTANINKPKPQVIDPNPIIRGRKLVAVRSICGEFESTINDQMKVRISCGANTKEFNVVGKQVSYVIDNFRDIMNIDSLSDILVNGSAASLSYVLKDGDNLEFAKKAGSKS